ncbi:MAG: precorrin-6y C5,15-methyltransferase (decarboxylating) subunit CbiE [Pseudomonadota bacterium]|nr:precorrin-6y C5,15-methyltransferase (decarboxylating) subunit CbiE [Pseudomonadota bacterium]MDE3037995.1 precorrin-6y C5,15-methyltransferase (decarboxylating) subunit CbiE [Pseudomonadota bacterium]
MRMCMTDSVAWLSVIGISENGLAGIPAGARALISSAALVAGGKRHLELAGDLIRGRTLAWPSPPHDAIPALLAMRPKPVCVLSTGDPFHYGMGAVLARHIPPQEMRVFPAPSIFSLVAAHMGWALQNVVAVGLNGRPVGKIIPHLQPGARIIALSADETTPALLAALLNQRGFGNGRLTVFEHLGGLHERICSTDAASFSLENIARLNCMAIEIPDTAEIKAYAISLTPGLADDWFEHDGQMTKREVRAITLSALAPRRGELLWDIGLGAGSIAIEWLLSHPSSRAIGFEKNAERAARAARNAKALGVPQLVVLEGEAPAILAELELPDAIFIGGGAAAPGMIETCWSSLKPGGRLVINAISLETESLLLAAYKQYGGALIRIGVERADPVSASMTGWRPAMTVTQWSVTK